MGRGRSDPCLRGAGFCECPGRSGRVRLRIFFDCSQCRRRLADRSFRHGAVERAVPLRAPRGVENPTLRSLVLPHDRFARRQNARAHISRLRDGRSRRSRTVLRPAAVIRNRRQRRRDGQRDLAGGAIRCGGREGAPRLLPPKLAPRRTLLHARGAGFCVSDEAPACTLAARRGKNPTYHRDHAGSVRPHGSFQPGGRECLDGAGSHAAGGGGRCLGCLAGPGKALRWSSSSSLLHCSSSSLSTPRCFFSSGAAAWAPSVASSVAFA